MHITRRPRRTLTVSIATVLLVSGCSSTGVDRDSERFDEPGAAPAAFSSATVFDDIEPQVSENSTAGIAPGNQFLFRNDRSDEVELSVSLGTDDLGPFEPDGELLDGTPISILDNGRDPNLLSGIRFDRDDGTNVVANSLSLPPETLVSLIDGVDFPTEDTITDIDGYTLVSTVPQPYFVDGYGTTYELDNGASASINVHTMLVDEFPLWEFASAEQITVLDDVLAYVVRSVRLGTINLVFRYPETDYLVRVGIFAEATPDRNTFPIDETDLDSIVDAIELRQPSEAELER